MIYDLRLHKTLEKRIQMYTNGCLICSSIMSDKRYDQTVSLTLPANSMARCLTEVPQSLWIIDGTQCLSPLLERGRICGLLFHTSSKKTHIQQPINNTEKEKEKDLKGPFLPITRYTENLCVLRHLGPICLARAAAHEDHLGTQKPGSSNKGSVCRHGLKQRILKNLDGQQKGCCKLYTIRMSKISMSVKEIWSLKLACFSDFLKMWITKLC